MLAERINIVFIVSNKILNISSEIYIEEKYCVNTGGKITLKINEVIRTNLRFLKASQNGFTPHSSHTAKD